MLKTYRKCFVGKDCVEWLVRKKLAVDERHAEYIGRWMSLPVCAVSHVASGRKRAVIRRDHFPRSEG